MHYYSAHDTTLNGILIGLDLVDIDEHSWPPYAADITIEIWKNSDAQCTNQNNYFIRVYYCDKVGLFCLQSLLHDFKKKNSF
jgi:hypothetical protein